MSSSTGGLGRKTKRERREEMARKRDERAVRAAHRKERKAQAYLADDVNFASFANQLASMGLKLRDIPGDGNCLFRALGDQLDGHGKNHLKHREDIVKYMQEHRQDFEPFVEDDIPFERYIANLRKAGTYAGNDAIVAFARLHALIVVIHQMNSPLWQIQGSDDKNSKQLHISYHNGDHYSSVRKVNDVSQNPTSINLKADGTPLDGSNSQIKSQSQPKHQMTSYQNGYSGASHYNVYHDSSTDRYSWYCGDDIVDADVVGDYDVVDSAAVEPVGSTYGTSQVDGTHVARAIRDVDAIVEQISHETGCQDLNLIESTLEDSFMDIGATVAFITQVMATQEPMSASQDSGIWSPDGSGSRIFGESGTGTKPKQKLSSAKVKRNKKQEKKQRASERHKLFVLGKAGVNSSYGGNNSRESSDEDAMIVKSLKTLNI